jgi:hypothetical protein
MKSWATVDSSATESTYKVKLKMLENFLSDSQGTKLYITEVFKEWNKFESTVMSNKGPLTVKWNNVQKLAAAWSIQTQMGGGGVTSLSNFFKNFDTYHNKLWMLNQNFGVYDLPDTPTIIDIGAGASIMNMFAYKYLPNSKFYLIDKQNWDVTNTSKVNYSRRADDQCWKHDWSVAEDAITSSNFDRQKFNFLDVNDNWDCKADLITSSMAWGMHFHKSVYWDRCIKSLKVGGKLVLDINAFWLTGMVNEIDEELKCKHTIMVSFPKSMISIDTDKYLKILKSFYPNVKYDDTLEYGTDIVAARCMWTRK